MAVTNDERRDKALSKFLSMVLRHKPEAIGIALDKGGWTDVHILIRKMNDAGKAIDFAILCDIVETNGKQRFAFNEDRTKIRANQGHSVEVELGYAPQTPPEVLFHGTTETAVADILKTGLERRNRHHVHLSLDPETAHKVGQRRGKPVILEVLSGNMHRDGFEFFLSVNGIWLTDHVPAQYLRLNGSNKK